MARGRIPVLPGTSVGGVVNLRKLVVPRPEMPVRSRDDPVFAKFTEANVSVLLPPPEKLMVPMRELTVSAPADSTDPVPSLTKLSVPPPIVTARPVMRPDALLPPLRTLLSSTSVPPALMETAPAVRLPPLAPDRYTELLLTVSVPVMVLMPVIRSVPVPEYCRPCAPVPVPTTPLMSISPEPKTVRVEAALLVTVPEMVSVLPVSMLLMSDRLALRLTLVPNSMLLLPLMMTGSP